MREVWIYLGHTETTPGTKSREVGLGLEGSGVTAKIKRTKPGDLQWN